MTFFGAVPFLKRISRLYKFDLVISGSRWNQALLKQQGIRRAHLVHLRWTLLFLILSLCLSLLNRKFVIFPVVKLENRKGQDIVIAAFRRLLRSYPDAF